MRVRLVAQGVRRRRLRRGARPAAARSPRRRGARSASAGWRPPSGSPWRRRWSPAPRTPRARRSGRSARACGVGCRYWPMVMKSTPAQRMSSITCSTSSRALAEADHQAGLGELVGVALLGPLQQAQRGVVAGAGPDRMIEPRHGLQVVVEHVGPRRRWRSRPRPACAGSPASGSRWSRPAPRRGSPPPSRRSGAAPPSARSSRSTEVMTTCFSPIFATASADARRLGGIERARACRWRRCRSRRRACRPRP